MNDLVEGRGNYAKGNRFLSPGALKVMLRHRLIANIIMTFLTKLASGYWHIFDPQNGFTAVRREKLQLLDLKKLNVIVPWLSNSLVPACDKSEGRSWFVMIAENGAA